MVEHYFILTLATLLGCGLGSFLAGAAFGMPRGPSAAHSARSFCPRCGRMTRQRRNPSVLGRVLPQGHCFCPECRKVWPHCLVLEVACAALFALNVFVAEGNLVRFASLSLLVAYSLLAGAIRLGYAMVPLSLSAQVAVLGVVSAGLGGGPAFAAERWMGRMLSSLGGIAVGAVSAGFLMLIEKCVHRRLALQALSPRPEAGVTSPTTRKRCRGATRGDFPQPVRQATSSRNARGCGDAGWLASLGAWVGPAGAVEVLCLALALAFAGIALKLIKRREIPAGFPVGPWLPVSAYVLLIFPHFI